MVLQGDIFTDNDIRVDGEVKGNIHAKGKIVVGPNGKIKGKLTGHKIIVHGKVTGDCMAYDEFVIQPGGTLRGNIRTKRVTIMDEGCFDGNCIINNENFNAAENPETLRSGIIQPDNHQKDSSVRNHESEKEKSPKELKLPDTEETENQSSDTMKKQSLLFQTMKNNTAL